MPKNVGSLLQKILEYIHCEEIIEISNCFLNLLEQYRKAHFFGNCLSKARQMEQHSLKYVAMEN